MFTAHFHAWDSDTKVRTAADYEKRVAEMKAKQAAGAPAAAEPEWAKPAEEAPAPVAAAAAAEPEPEAPPAAAEAPTEPAAEYASHYSCGAPFCTVSLLSRGIYKALGVHICKPVLAVILHCSTSCRTDSLLPVGDTTCKRTAA